MADGKVRIQIDTNAGKATNELKGFDKAVKDTKKDGGELVHTNNALQGSMNKLTSVVKGLVGAYIGLQGIKAVTGYVLDSVEAFRTQERAIVGLETSLMNAGVYTAEYSRHLQELASSIQSYSNYGDEAIEKAIGLGQAFAGQTRFTDDLIKATIDFASAMDMDLDSAFNLVGKSIGTSTNALGRYGVELKKGMTDSQKMQAIVEQLGARYDGQAENMANASVKLHNAVGDLSEVFGNIFNPTIEKVQIKLREGIVQFTNWLKHVYALKGAIAGLDEEGLTKRIQRDQEILDKFSKKKFSTASKGYVDAIKKDLENAQNQLSKIKDIQKEREELSKNNGFKMKDGTTIPTVTTPKSVTHIKTAYEQLQDSVEKARMSVLNMATTYGTSSTQVQQAMTVYRNASQQLANVNDVLKESAQEGGAYQQLNDRLQELKQSLLDLGASGQIGTEQFESIKNEFLAKSEEMKEINKALSEEVGKDWDAINKNISSTLSSTLVDALRDGGNAMQSFANIAVNALERILQKLIEMAIITPIVNSFTGGFGGSLLSGLFAKGGAFENGVQKFASGGVVNKPTTFAMAGGKTGLMGEAGAEAIMPLKRTASGDLGIQATQPNINIYNQSGAQIETVERPDGDMDIFIKRVNNALANERTQQGFSNALRRNDTRGLQAS